MKELWYPLGGGVVCTIDGCGKPAYKKCDGKLVYLHKKLWEGCGEAMCIEHMDVYLMRLDEYEDVDNPS